MACVLGGGLAQAVSGGACLVVASDIFDTAEGRSLTTAHLVSATGLRLTRHSKKECSVSGSHAYRGHHSLLSIAIDLPDVSVGVLAKIPAAQLTACAEQLSRPKAAVQRDRPRIPATSHSGTGTTAPT